MKDFFKKLFELRGITHSEDYGVNPDMFIKGRCAMCGMQLDNYDDDEHMVSMRREYLDNCECTLSLTHPVCCDCHDRLVALVNLGDIDYYVGQRKIDID